VGGEGGQRGRRTGRCGGRDGRKLRDGVGVERGGVMEVQDGSKSNV